MIFSWFSIGEKYMLISIYIPSLMTSSFYKSCRRDNTCCSIAVHVCANVLLHVRACGYSNVLWASFKQSHGTGGHQTASLFPMVSNNVNPYWFSWSWGKVKATEEIPSNPCRWNRPSHIAKKFKVLFSLLFTTPVLFRTQVLYAIHCIPPNMRFSICSTDFSLSLLNHMSFLF